MTKSTTAPNPALQWIRSYASENPRSVASRVKNDRAEAIAARMNEEVREGGDKAYSDWLIAHELAFPSGFDTLPYRAVDLKDLTAAGRLGVANGEDPAGQPKRRGSK